MPDEGKMGVEDRAPVAEDHGAGSGPVEVTPSRADKVAPSVTVELAGAGVGGADAGSGRARPLRETCRPDGLVVRDLLRRLLQGLFGRHHGKAVPLYPHALPG